MRAGTDAKPCTKCGQEPRVPGQRWGLRCRADYQASSADRAERAAEAAAQRELEGVVTRRPRQRLLAGQPIRFRKRSGDEGPEVGVAAEPMDVDTMRHMARLRSARAIERLTRLMNHATSENVCIAAAREILDRAYGRSTQEIDMHGAAQTLFVIALNNPTRDPLARIDVTPKEATEAVLDLSGILARPAVQP